MVALGPLPTDNDTLLVALRAHAPTQETNAAGMGADAPYTYLSLSLDRRDCPGKAPAHGVCGASPCCVVAPETFFRAVLEHALEWKRVFEPGMQMTLPYPERRQLDMARVRKNACWCHLCIKDRFAKTGSGQTWEKLNQEGVFLQGVIVAASTVFIGDIPNYGTGGNYWRSSPPVPAEHTPCFTMQHRCFMHETQPFVKTGSGRT
eukprot:COSAG06_NODE_9090_length_1989_cov_4.921456_2_plen_205_part_00